MEDLRRRRDTVGVAVELAATERSLRGAFARELAVRQHAEPVRGGMVPVIAAGPDAPARGGDVIGDR